MTAVIDLNSDLGEGYGAWSLGDDVALLEVVSSANVACGFHAGDPTTIARTVATAIERGVRVGAQVSYPDLAGFGRRRIDVAPADLCADVLYQVGAVAGFCRVAGGQLSYVKPHGALYNTICDDERQAGAFVSALLKWPDPLPLLILPGSVAATMAAESGVEVVGEGFADRAYTPAGRLVSRSVDGAVLHDVPVIVERALGMVREERVVAADGTQVSTAIRSLCVHGDTPGAVEIARRLRTALTETGVAIKAFT